MDRKGLTIGARAIAGARRAPYRVANETLQDGSDWLAGLDSLLARVLCTVPLSVYFNENAFLKVNIGLARGKKLQDKREDLKRKDQDREVSRQMKAFI